MENDNDNNTEYTTNTLNTSYTIIQESELSYTWLDSCIAECIHISSGVVYYIFCCCCYNEDDD